MLQAHRNSVATSSLPMPSVTLEASLAELLEQCVPAFFDALARFQFQQALGPLQHYEQLRRSMAHASGSTATPPTSSGPQNGRDPLLGMRSYSSASMSSMPHDSNGESVLHLVGAASAPLDSGKWAQWKSFDAWVVAMKLLASCESTYHLMKYLESEMLATNTIERLYHKLIVIVRHVADELKPLVARQRRQRSLAPRDAQENDMVSSTKTLSFYQALYQQAAVFFSLRLSMIEMYKSLAEVAKATSSCVSPSSASAAKLIDYAQVAQELDNTQKGLDPLDHPMLVPLRVSFSEEVATVRAAVFAEQQIAEYHFTQAMVAMHRLKQCLHSWADHIDMLAYFPSATDSEDEVLSDSGWSDSNYSSTTSLTAEFTEKGKLATNSVSGKAMAGHLVKPSALTRGKSCSSMLDSPAAIEPDRSQTSRDRAMPKRSTPTAPAQNRPDERRSSSSRADIPLKLSKLLTPGGLLKRGMSISALGVSHTAPLRHLVRNFAPRSSAAGAVASDSAVPHQPSFEHVLLGGVNALPSTTASLHESVVTNPSVVSEERDDGYALPVFQWSKRLYRSLLAKFSLYFYRWLEPFENQGEVLVQDLLRCIRNPVGISYLNLMDALLARGSVRGDEGKIWVMLVLEIDALANRGYHYYAHGYLCPSSSRAESLIAALEAGKGDAKPSHPSSKRGPSQQERSSPKSRDDAAPRSTRNPGRQCNGLFQPVDMDGEGDDADFSPLWGLRGWPAVFCYPHEDPPLQHWPNIVSLIMDNRHALHATHPVFSHSERRLKAVYYLSRIDPAMYLVTLTEGKRRPSEKTTQDFMASLTESLRHACVYGSWKWPSMASSSS